MLAFIAGFAGCTTQTIAAFRALFAKITIKTKFAGAAFIRFAARYTIFQRLRMPAVSTGIACVASVAMLAIYIFVLR
jgi:phosphoribulokinase